MTTRPPLVLCVAMTFVACTSNTPCDTNSDCEDPRVCVESLCLAPCVDDSTCAAGQLCFAGLCRLPSVTSMVAAVAEPSGPNCAAGGIAILTGVDSNGDGTLQSSEATQTTYVCYADSSGVLAGVYDVTWSQFGAVGDGIADDAAALQGAVDAAAAAGGGIVFIPPGSYRVASTVLLRDDVTVAGASMDASHIVAADGLNSPVIRNADIASGNRGIGVLDLTVDGNGDNQVYAPSGIAEDLPHGLFLRDVTHVTIARAHFKDALSLGLAVRSTLNNRDAHTITVSDSLATGAGDTGFNFDFVRGLALSNCIARDNGGRGPAGPQFGNGFWFAHTDDSVAQGLLALDNGDMDDVNAGDGIVVVSSKRLVISDFTSTGNRRDGVRVAALPWETDPSCSDSSVVSGVSSANGRSGVRAEGRSVYDMAFENILATDNAGDGFVFFVSDRNWIAGCEARSNGARGFLALGAQELTFEGCAATDNGDDGFRFMPHVVRDGMSNITGGRNWGNVRLSSSHATANQLYGVRAFPIETDPAVEIGGDGLIIAGGSYAGNCLGACNAESSLGNADTLVQGAVGLTYHKRIVLPAPAFETTVGTVADAVVATRWSAKELIDGSDNNVGTLVTLPLDWVPNTPIQPYFAWTRVGAETSDTVVWNLLLSSIAPDGTLNESDVFFAQSEMSPPTNDLAVTAGVDTLTPAASDVSLGVRIGRFGAGMGDNFTGSVMLLYIELEYTAAFGVAP